MKLLRFGPNGQEKPGILDKQGNIRDLSGIIPDLAGEALAPDSLERVRRLDTFSLPLVSSDVRLGSCVAKPGHFIAVGLNYADHALEAKLPIPDEPLIFSKAPSSVAGPNDDVRIPALATQVDWEVEVAVVIGSSTFGVTELQANESIAGFCVCNDLSERNFQLRRGGQWLKGKSMPTFGPLGPWLVTRDEIANVKDLDLWLEVNGVRKQNGSTRNMIFSFPYIISYLSQFMRLDPGDVITTGTPPGVGMAADPQEFLQVGDVITLGVGGLGTQKQTVVRY